MTQFNEQQYGNCKEAAIKFANDNPGYSVVDAFKLLEDSMTLIFEQDISNTVMLNINLSRQSHWVALSQDGFNVFDVTAIPSELTIGEWVEFMMDRYL